MELGTCRAASDVFGTCLDIQRTLWFKHGRLGNPIVNGGFNGKIIQKWWIPMDFPLITMFDYRRVAAALNPCKF